MLEEKPDESVSLDDLDPNPKPLLQLGTHRLEPFTHDLSRRDHQACVSSIDVQGLLNLVEGVGVDQFAVEALHLDDDPILETERVPRVDDEVSTSFGGPTAVLDTTIPKDTPQQHVNETLQLGRLVPALEVLPRRRRSASLNAFAFTASG